MSIDPEGGTTSRLALVASLTQLCHIVITSCGMHLIYAQNQDDHKKRSRNDNPAEDDSQSQSHHKRSRQHDFLSANFF